MSRIATFLMLSLLLLARPAHATEATAAADAQTVAAITAQVQDFLAHVDQRDTHDRFWASDLVYTSSSGEVSDKATIMKGFEAPPAAPAPSAPATDGPASEVAGHEATEAPVTFTAEDIRVRPYGDAAALTFRLVMHAPDGKLTFYRNSGMFVRRDGRWQAVTWQATKVPEPEAKQ